MTWVKLNAGTYLENAQPTSPVPPNDYWAQIDVWIPAETFDACPAFNPSVFSPSYLSIVQQTGAIITSLRSQGHPPTNFWISDQGGVGGPNPGPAAATIYTLKVHVQTSIAKATWFVNGAQILVQTGLTFTSFPWRWRIGWNGFGCCCDEYYFTNFWVGTTDGGTDIFATDFSAGFDDPAIQGWLVQNSRFASPALPAFAVVVDSPTDDQCPTCTISPPRGQKGDTVTISGGGFGTFTPLSLHIGGLPVEADLMTDGSGDYTVTLPIPAIFANVNNPQTVFVDDGNANVACATLTVCGPRAADGINSDAGQALQGGTFNATNVHGANNHAIDYIFHDGAHWILWRDPSCAQPTNLVTFPPPANVSMNLTRISADGSSVVDYPVDTNYAWAFSTGSDGNPGLNDTHSPCGEAAPNWSTKAFFTSWAKPVYDAKLASDGTNLWIAVLTAETVPYPWLDNRDAHGINPGAAAQTVPLSVLTSGFTSFATSAGTGYTRIYANPTGPLDIFKDTAFPLTDAGAANLGVWAPPVVVMFAWNGSGVTRIGEVDAKYCPAVFGGQTSGYANRGGSLIGGLGAQFGAPRCSYFSRLAVAADPSQPGVCHLVWGEGGDWGRVADGQPCVTGPYGGTRFTWDGGPANRDYRINYTTWTPSGKASDTDLWHEHIDRTNWFFPWDDFGQGGSSAYNHGYTYPHAGDNICGAAFILRADAGKPILFLAFTTAFQNIWDPDENIIGPNPPGAVPPSSHGPNLDFSSAYADSLGMYDISGGSPVLLQSLDLASGLLPTEDETTFFLTQSQQNTFSPPYSPDCLALGQPVATASAAPGDLAFGISLVYDDPLDGGNPVYLLHVPVTRRWTQETGFSGEWFFAEFAERIFVRIPTDGSAPFDYLDGNRQVNFTIVQIQGSGVGVPSIDTIPGCDFFSDARDIWLPAVAEYITDDGSSVAWFNASPLWFDRICDNEWEFWQQCGDDTFVWPSSASRGTPGFHYDPDADSITYIAEAIPTRGGGWTPVPLFYVETYFISRKCRPCTCGPGVHIARRL